MKVIKPSSLSLALTLYEWLWVILRNFLLVFGRLSPNFRGQLLGRKLDEVQLLQWAAQRQKQQHCVLVFCSSAGEYEQAKPLVSRLQRAGDCFIALILVSASGLRFAKAQHEMLPLMMAPWDQPKAWNTIFAALRPDFFLVIRYELWPGFLATARSWAPVYLVNGVRSPGLEARGIAQYLRRYLVGMCESVFVVGLADQKFFVDLMQWPLDRIIVAGDTKYDRVLERLEERKASRLGMERQLANFLGSSPVLILGSAWPKDLEALLTVFEEVRQVLPGMKLIVVPHDIGSGSVSSMARSLSSMGLSICRVQSAGIESAQASDDVLLVDQIGLLPELYAVADIAWIGGAFHYRVHNVLEAACQGLYVCFGSKYHTSQEARQLVQADLVKVIDSGLDFLQWVKQLRWQGRPPHRELYAAVLEQQGASDRILAGITRF